MRVFTVTVDCFAQTEERVVKANETVEDMIRSDGARYGHRSFFVSIKADSPDDAVARLSDVFQKLVDDALKGEPK